MEVPGDAAGDAVLGKRALARKAKMLEQSYRRFVVTYARFAPKITDGGGGSSSQDLGARHGSSEPVMRTSPSCLQIRRKLGSGDSV